MKKTGMKQVRYEGGLGKDENEKKIEGEDKDENDEAHGKEDEKGM